MVGTPASYMGALGFKFRPGPRMHLGFLGFKLYVYRPRWRINVPALQNLKSQQQKKTFKNIIYSGPTNALVCNKTLIRMSHTKTLKITPTMFSVFF
jgi:hypothetical protein